MNINQKEAELRDYVRELCFLYDLPGLCVTAGICHPGSEPVSVRAAAGFQNALEKTPLSVNHIFHMASVSKLFTSTAILKLWEDRLLSLDGRLTDYLPWFSMADTRFREITIRQMLSHTSGMPDVSDYHWETPETDEGALKRYATSEEVRGSHLLWSPSEGRFCYSNMAYEILGCVIAELSHMPYENFIAEQIFRPLAMDDTTMLTFTRDMSTVCTPHEKNAEKQFTLVAHFPYNRAHGPSSTLTSNSLDIENWAAACINRSLLREETYAEAFSQHGLVPNNGEHICLGWFQRVQNGSVLYGHEGTDDGFRASFWFCPDRSLFINVNSNLTGAPVKKINKLIFDFLTEAPKS